MSYGGFSHGATLDRTEKALHTLKPFKRQGYGMSAVEGAVQFFGQLPAEHIEQYRTDRPRYTVLSYDTPIAWITQDGTVRQPAVKYSQTTTQHQYACQYHLNR